MNKKKIAIYYIVVVLSLIIGLMVGKGVNSGGGGTVINPDSPLYGEEIPEYDDEYTGWYFLKFTEENSGWDSVLGITSWRTKTEKHPMNVIFVLVLYVILFIAPIIQLKVGKKKKELPDVDIDELLKKGQE